MIEITDSLASSTVFLAAAATKCTPGSIDCIAPGTLSVLDGLKVVIKTLLLDDGSSGGQSLFSIVLQPCKVFTGLGIMWSLAPLLNSSVDTIKQEFTKIITLFVLAVLLMGNGDVARALGVANYATMKGIEQAISEGISKAAAMPEKIENIAKDKAAGQEINDKYDQCISTKSTITDASGTKPNPEYEKCRTELISLVNAKISSNPTLAPGLQKFVNDFKGRGGNAAKAAKEYEDVTGFTGWLKGVTTDKGLKNVDLSRAIFNGWKTAGFLTLDFALVISIMVLPIFLALSLMNISPLVGWFSAFWGIGIYQITMIVMSDSFLIVEAKVGPTIAILTSEIGVSMVAPTLAGAIALGGAWGMFSAMQTITDSTRGSRGGSNSATSNATNNQTGRPGTPGF
jgi:hypothetical protein